MVRGIVARLALATVIASSVLGVAGPTSVSAGVCTGKAGVYFTGAATRQARGTAQVDNRCTPAKYDRACVVLWYTVPIGAKQAASKCVAIPTNTWVSFATGLVPCYAGYYFSQLTVYKSGVALKQFDSPVYDGTGVCIN